MAGMQEKQLAQLRPTDTNAASLYSPPSGFMAIVKAVYVCNQSGVAATFRIFCDDDGTTYDQTTALVYDKTVQGGAYEIFGGTAGVILCMNDPNGNLAVRSGTANALTFTAFGAEIVV